MIPVPRASLLNSAILVATVFGVLIGLVTTSVVAASVRPDLVIALVLGVPSALGLLTVLFSRRAVVTAAGVFALAVAPGWFGVLVAIQVTNGG